MRYECTNCGAEARHVRGDYRFEESGLKNVVLRDIEVIHCDRCGNEDPVLQRPAKLMRALAQAVIAQPFRLSGEEFRFLRKHMRLTAEELGRIMHVDKTTISKWENNADPIGEQSDLLIRAVAMALGEGLKGASRDLVRRFDRITSRPRRLPELRISVTPDEGFSYEYSA